jgi:hypothetical protein
MTTITIDGRECAVARTLRPGFVIADGGGAYAYASLAADGSGEWEWWAGSPSAEDAVALREVIEANGGFDHTTIEISPPDPPEPA